MDDMAAVGVRLAATRCPICGTTNNAVELYPARLSGAAFDATTFSARRLPDRVHYRVVRCKTCGLVRSDPVADPTVQAALYARSTFDYGDQVDNLRLSYGRYLQRLRQLGAGGALLEIGCGSGFMLEEALRQGFSRAAGVEPSTDAVANAHAGIRASIVCDVMRPGLFQAGEFDAVCMFQTFDHISDPDALLDECRRVLKPGGFLLCFNHDVAALSAWLLRERSPIIDVEHPFLYNRHTLARLVEGHGFRIVESGVGRNRVTLRYLGWLAPLPSALKRPMLAALNRVAVGRLTISLPLGNLYLIGRTQSAG